MNVMLAGASVRAMAQSAVRAGCSVCGLDLFGDRDLSRLADSHRIQTYPGELADWARRLPGRQWAFTGGLENYPQLIGRISRTHRLLGNPEGVLRRIRNPWLVASSVRSAGCRFPSPSWNLPSDGNSYVRKPIDSCGGLNMCLAADADAPEPMTANDSIMHGEGRISGNDSNDLPDNSPGRRFYFQPFVSGPVWGVTFLGNGQTAVLLGAARHVNWQWSGARQFQYSGSMGPLTITRAEHQALQRLGHQLVVDFTLRGLFGVDLVCNDRQFWVLEVNPRFTASVEVIERNWVTPAFTLHQEACRDRQLVEPTQVTEPLSPGRFALHAKGILYASRGVRVSESNIRRWEDPSWIGSDQQISDVPQIGSEIPPRYPVLTLLASGERPRDIAEKLDRLARRVAATFER